MRVPLYVFLLIFLSGLVPWQAQAAQPRHLQRLIAEFEALDSNPVRGARRDLWLALEEKFAAAAAKNKGDAGAGAAFYHARAREELGFRSFLPADHREAVSRFASVAARYPRYRVASESLYRQAVILLHRLEDAKTAASVLKNLLKNYPRAKEAAEAKKLLAQAEAKPERSGAAVPDKAGRAPRASGGAAQKGESVMEQLGLSVRTIMIDAGHGGNDPGARAMGITEKNFTLSMARRVGALLQKEGFTVLYTRASDTYIPLQARPDTANSKKADLFISIHVNANTKRNIRGLETYYLDEAKTQDAATVAARENGVAVKNISDLQVILTDLALSSKVKESHHLADCVHKGILQRLSAAGFAAPDNGVRSAPFYVLVGARMPAILVEFGYITNRHDAANLKNEIYLQRQAEGLARGIRQYKAELSKAVPRPK